MLLTTKHTCRIDEWSKALVLATSHFGCVGLSPTPFILLTFLYRIFCPLFWTPAHVFFAIIHTIDIPIQSILSCILNTCRWYLLTSWMLWPHNIQAGLLSGLRRWFNTPVTLMAWIRVLLLSFCWHSYTKICSLKFEHLHMVSSTIIHAIDHKTYRQDGRGVWGAGLR